MVLHIKTKMFSLMHILGGGINLFFAQFYKLELTTLAHFVGLVEKENRIK